jgi:phage baseplate assembly protein W
MPNYIGFSTIDANKPRTTNAPPGLNGGPGSITDSITSGKRYRLTDQQLVIRDLLNAFNIPQGQKVGQPEYGTTIWSFVFEPNTQDVQTQLQEEIRRIANSDPRIKLGDVACYPQENGILVEIQISVSPFNQAELLSVFFNTKTNSASAQ